MKNKRDCKAKRDCLIENIGSHGLLPAIKMFISGCALVSVIISACLIYYVHLYT